MNKETLEHVVNAACVRGGGLEINVAHTECMGHRVSNPCSCGTCCVWGEHGVSGERDKGDGY